ncbi:MAG TPA: integrase arm-type DNA-binding domain-containing protein, partial [Methylophilaceae bacterium]|nr:integrase arm-type DNA-binding domain-containing protein [Methylophilaceae bacterium]
MLTDTALRNIKPKDKPFKLADEKGLYLLVQPTGGKLWRFDYRYLAKRKTLALGAYPDVPLSKARQERDAARQLLGADIDPGENRKAAKASKQGSAANSFEVIAREWASTHLADKSASHRERVSRRFELFLYPWIGSKPITDITAPQVLEC